MNVPHRHAAARTAWLAVISWGVSGCVSMEPGPAPPHVNLSAENVTLTRVADGPRADFGIDAVPNESDSLADLRALPGVRVRAVRRQSPAQRAGLQPGDVILSVNDVETNHPDVLAAMADAAGTGDRFVFEVRRDTVVFEATVEAPPRISAVAPQERYRADPILTRAGYRTELLRGPAGPALPAVRITRLFPESPLPASGLDSGDLIVALDGEAVDSAQGLINRLHRYQYGDRVRLSVLSAAHSPGHDAEHDAEHYGEARDVTVRLWHPGRRLSALALRPLFNYESRLDPPVTRFSILDLWLVSLLKYERQQDERELVLFTLFRFGSGHGELVEETPRRNGP